jgi:hypothetical protein
LLNLSNIGTDESQPLLCGLGLDKWRELLVDLKQLLDTSFQLVLGDNLGKQLVSLLLGFEVCQEHFDSIHENLLILLVQTDLLKHRYQHLKILHDQTWFTIEVANLAEGGQK